MQIRFYDNDKNNFEGMAAMGIDTFLVDETIPNSIFSSSDDSPSFQTYFTLMKKAFTTSQQKEYFRYLENNFNFATLPLPCEGLTAKQCIDIEKWVTPKLPRNRLLLLDWDRTLTAVEGYFTSPHETKHLQEAEFQFIFGSSTRLDRIQSMINTCFHYKVPVYILTNNTGAQEDKNYFVQFMRLLSPHFSEQHLLPSSQSPSKAHFLIEYFKKKKEQEESKKTQPGRKNTEKTQKKHRKKKKAVTLESLKR